MISLQRIQFDVPENGVIQVHCEGLICEARFVTDQGIDVVSVNDLKSLNCRLNEINEYRAVHFFASLRKID